MAIHQNKNLIFRFVEISDLSSFIIFSIFGTILHHGQGNWSFFNNNRLKLSTPTLNKPVLSFSDYHTSSASNLTRTSISSILDNKDITTNKNKNNTSNTDEFHSCVTPQKNTVFRLHLQPLIWRHLMIHCIVHLLSYTQQLNYPPPW